MRITTGPSKPVLVPCSLRVAKYQIDPYTGCSHYCYYCYALNQAETDWTQEIRIYEDIKGELREEIADLAPQTIYMGYTTDPYQPCEAEYRQTRQVLEVLLEKGFSVSILTKSDLVLRDLDVLRQMPDASVSVSVAFNDNKVRKSFEADTKDTEDRIAALAQLRAAGIDTSALICPVIPYITDVFFLVDQLFPLTTTLWIYGLSIENRRDKNWQHLSQILDRSFPCLKKEIEAAVFSKDHDFWSGLRQALEQLAQQRQLNLSIHV